MEIVADQPGERLDVAVARLCDLSRAQAHRLIEEGRVAQAGKLRRKAGDKLIGGETLTVRIPPLATATPEASAIPLDIVFEDESLIVVNKPPGMAVHPGPGHHGDTLVNALLAHCPDLPGINGVQRPGIVHRLDRDTSGLIVVAKTEVAQRSLTRQLKDRTVKKTYLALVEGRVEPPEAIIDAPLGRDPHNRLRQMVRDRDGRAAQTVYRVREYFDGCTFVEASPITGRTHQIRVHFASMGHPIVGDEVYGKPSKLVSRQFLHAWRLALVHPVSGEAMEFEAPMPPDLDAALTSCRGGGHSALAV